MSGLRLNQQVIVVTGAASGIGRQIALECLEEGACVVAVDIDAQGLASLGVEAGTCANRVLISVTDVTRTEGIEAMVDRSLRQFRTITGLVHSAYWTHPQVLTDTTVDDFQKTLGITLTGAFLLSQAMIPVLLDHGGGSIVPIASVHSLVAFPGYFAYQVAKAGLLGFVRSVATDYAPTIRCNALAPGAIDSPALNDAPPDVRRRVEEQALLKRVGTVHEVARAAIFLLSEESAFMTGTTMVLDGGWTAG